MLVKTCLLGFGVPLELHKEKQYLVKHVNKFMFSSDTGDCPIVCLLVMNNPEDGLEQKCT